MTTRSKVKGERSPGWAIQVGGFYISHILGENLAHGNYLSPEGGSPLVRAYKLTLSHD